MPPRVSYEIKSSRDSWSQLEVLVVSTDASFVKAFIYEEFKNSYVVMGHYSWFIYWVESRCKGLILDCKLIFYSELLDRLPS